MQNFISLGSTALVAAVLFSACGSDASPELGFSSPQECLEAIPLVQSEIAATELAERCGVDLDLAGAAMAAAASRSDAEPPQQLASTSESDGPDSTIPASSTTTPTTTTPSTTSTSLLVEPAEGQGIVVPNVIGVDHQLAQDTMQSVGLYFLSEMDGSGQGRSLLWDRNWTVVDQDPAAGTVVTSDTRITLISVKDTEV